MINKPTILLIAVAFIACNKIKSGNELQDKETAYIRSLGLLQDQEQIIKFYSNYKFKNAGNFFTNKRIAKYWIDKKDSSKNEIIFAYYDDILSIDSTTNVPSSNCPYLLVTRKDKSQFKVFVNGKKPVVNAFFTEAIRKWEESIKLTRL
ncbi:MAG: hypothetical protein ACTHMC_27685 [Pseudobacter sp.]|uniref:hypothetical protein n=1 Tax=Pseudobacter sp. TaxID=2045420 RepID=UPI003F81A684